MRPFLLFTLCLLPFSAAAQEPSASGEPAPAARWLQEQWTASWIGPAGNAAREYGVHLFRKDFSLAEVPEHFVVHVSADARFRMYVNGTSVASGPQRSDAWVRRFDSVDLASRLRSGTNVIAVRVWNYGEDAPCAIVNRQTGLILQGDTDAEAVVNTDGSWKVMRDDAYSPVPVNLPAYIVVGPGERVDGTRHPWGWEMPSYGDLKWSSAIEMGRGNPCGWGTGVARGLAPRTIPPMEEAPLRFAAVRRASGVSVPEGFTAGEAPLVVPAHTKASLLLDQGAETSAYPQLTLSGGAGAVLRLTYAEALIDANGNKGDRNEVAGRHIEGKSDEFVADGGAKRAWTSQTGPL